jgi:hypothetical protein
LPSGYLWQGAIVSGSTVYAHGTSSQQGQNNSRTQIVATTTNSGSSWSSSGGTWTVEAVGDTLDSSGVIVNGTTVLNYRYGSYLNGSFKVGHIAISANSGATFSGLSTPFTFIAMARGSRYVAVTTSGIASSNDGSNWVLRQSGSSSFGRIATTSNGYIATLVSSDDNYTRLYTSTDGLNWTQRATSSNAISGVDALSTFPIVVLGNIAATSSSLYDIGGVLSATFVSSASTTFGSPAMQWQQSSDGGATWTDISGAVSSPLSFTPVSGDSGKRYRAVYSKASYTTVNSNAATLTVP